MRIVLKTGAGVELVAGELLAENLLVLKQALIRGDVTFTVVPESAPPPPEPPQQVPPAACGRGRGKRPT